ncbi:hypothetical protein MACJ_000982 [Theileria orientalis]|uniref:Uncharacterized protein n=1 Tax=Theileria orientalis TaxID=68886 RepID=A0A976M7E0_THEOR|nr:hypothetical protein MACJ_000982 [Theileria orientalis]
MNINTIRTYVLVYLLARGHWNLIVPVRGGDDPDGSSVLGSGEAGQASPYTVLLNDLYPDFYTSSFSAGSDGSVASESDKEADTGSLLRGSNASGGDSQGAGVLTSNDSGLTSGADEDSTSSESSGDTSIPKTGVDLNLKSDTKSTDKFLSKQNGPFQTYTPKDNYAFKLVKDHRTELWEARDANNYSTRVEVDLMNYDAKAITIYFAENMTKVFKKDGENDFWTTIDTTKVNPCSLNITYSHETYLYKNEYKNNIRKFIPKTGFAFKCANEYVDGKKVEIWKTDLETEYSNKIEVDLINNDSKAVTVYMAGNKTRVFKKDGKNNPWNEIYTTIVNPRSINIKYERESYFCTNTIDNNGVRTLEAKTGFAFKCAHEYINYTRVEIWKAENENEYANKIVNEGKKVTIHLADGSTKMIEKGADGKWPGEGFEPSQNGDPKKQQAKDFFTDLNVVVNELSQGIDGANDSGELDSKLRDAAYKLTLELPKLLKLL